MTDRPENAPGCWGSPLAYGHTSLPCTRCPYQSDCGKAAEDRAARLRDLFGIQDAMRKRAAAPKPKPKAPAKPPPVPRPVAARVAGSLPKKSAELIASIQAKGINLPLALSHRANPFETRAPRFMRTVFDRLVGGGFTRQQLSEALIAELGWSRGTADSHAGLVVPALVHLGVATEEEGRVLPVRS